AARGLDRRAFRRPRAGRDGPALPFARRHQDLAAQRHQSPPARHAGTGGRPDMTIANPVTLPLAGFTPQHFQLSVEGRVATVTLNRPEKKNPLTFESYREFADFFLAAQKEEAVKAIVVTGAGGNFSSGGDVFEIIGPLVAMET